MKVSWEEVVPDGHVGAGDRRQLDGARETLVTLRVIVLQADLKLNGLEEVSLLGLVGVLQELGDLRPDISCSMSCQYTVGILDQVLWLIVPTVIFDILAVSQ